jgi:hypothetical protein
MVIKLEIKANQKAREGLVTAAFRYATLCGNKPLSQVIESVE